MNNIWKIFTTDVKKLVRQPFALIIIIGLCIIPALYAWFNIYANWDPYANTSGIPVAVCSLDKDYKMADGSVVNMGDSVLESLEENTSVNWIFLETEDELVDGVEAGEYYAGIVITEKFTYSMYNVFSDDFENPSLLYYQNNKANAIATKITDTVASTLQTTINETFIQVAATTIFEQGNTISDDITDDDYVKTFQEKVEVLNDNLKDYSTMIDSFLEGNDKLEVAIAQVNYDIPKMKDKIDQTANSLQQSSSDLSSSRTTLANFSANIDTSMANINASLTNINNSLENTALANDTEQAIKDMNQTAKDVNTLNGQISDLMNVLSQKQIESVSSGDAGGADLPQIPGENYATAIKALQAMQKEVDLVNSVIGSVLDATSDTAATSAKNQVNSALSSIQSAVSTCQTSVTNMQNIYKNQLVPQMESVLQSMSDALTQVVSLVNSLSTTMSNMGVVMTNVSDTMVGTSDSLEQIKDVVDGISAKLTTLTDQLDGAAEEEMLDIIVSFLGGDPDSLGEYFASPVTMETIAMYPVATYGSAMTPFYSTLAIWVGSTVLVALVKVKPSPKGLKDVQSYQLYFGRLLLFWVLAQIQAAIIAAGDLWLLDVAIVEPGLFFLAASFTATAFSFLIYSLTLAFGDVGKAICVIVMVLQIAGSSGTFPIELLPDVYQKIYIFFPFPYAITAMRECLAGMYGTAYMEALAKLCIFIIVGLLVGLVIRIPFVRLNHFVEERMEDTELM